MSQLFRYPPNGAASSNASVGPSGSAVPTSATLIGGKDPGGLLKDVSVDVNGTLNVNVIDTVFPTDYATETTLENCEATLGSIAAGTPDSIGQLAMAASMSVVIASDQSAIPVSAASLPLPTGAATETTLAAASAKLPATLGQKAMTASMAVVIASDQSAIPVSGTVITTNPSVSATGSAVPSSATMIGGTDGTNLRALSVSSAGVVNVAASALPLPTGAATETTLSALNTKVPANLTVTSTRLLVDGSGVTQPVSAASLPLPTGAATETTLAAMSAKLPAALGQTTMSASMSVAIASNQSNVPTSQAGRAKANAPTYNDYTSTAVTTSAYVQLIASTTSAANLVEIFDSSGQTLILAVGAAASEVDQFFIIPGGNGQVPLAIPAGSRVSIKAKTATANTGYIALNLYT